MSAKLLLTNKGVHFQEQKLGEDFTREILLEMFPHAKSFPVIVVDGFNIGGYQELKEQLERANNDATKFLIEG
jgi:glutaredoxin